jgi:hypothetical protein
MHFLFDGSLNNIWFAGLVRKVGAGRGDAQLDI